MTYATLFMPDGRFALSLLTRTEGGPFVVEYIPVAGEEPRCAGNAEWMLWSYVYDHAPGVFRRAQDAGFVRPPVAMVRTCQRLGLVTETAKNGEKV